MAHEPEPKTVGILGSKVYYWDFNPNNKEVIVMIHGFRGTHHGLQRIIDSLPGFRVIVPDLPGFGDSSAMNNRSHDVKNYAEFTKRFIKFLGVKKPVLLGHSFGSIVAASVVADDPELVSKLICVNPVATTKRKTRGIKLAAGKLYHWLGTKALPERLGLALLRSTTLFLIGSKEFTKTKDKELQDFIHQSHITYFGKFHSRQTLSEAYNASVTNSISEYASQINVPTLLIAGDLDELTPPDGQYAIQKLIPKAKLVMIPDVGHIIHYEKPKQAASAIQSFLAGE